MTSKKDQHNKKFKSKEYDEYSAYSDDNFGNYSDDNFGSYSQETEEDFASQLKQYRQAKETSSSSLGSSFSKETGKKTRLKGSQQGESEISLLEYENLTETARCRLKTEKCLGLSQDLPILMVPRSIFIFL